MEQERTQVQRRKEALQKIRSGYSALFKNIDDTLTYFAPEGDEDTKAMFLDEPEFKAQREDLKKLVDSMLELFGQAENPAQAQTIAGEKVKAATELKKKNLAKIVEEARPLEQSYRQLDLFYKNAGPNKLEHVTILNIDKSMVNDPDDETLTSKVRDILAEPHLRIDQDKVYSLMVIPGFLGEKLIQTYADIAHDNKVLFMSDYKDMPSVETTLKYRNSPEGEKIGGMQKYWSHAVMFANWINMRGKYADLGEKDNLYGSPAMAITGKLYASKISQPAAGVQFGEVKQSGGLKYDINQPQVGLLSKAGLNALADFYQQNSPWEATTMFNGANLELKHYAVVRTLDWIDKTLKHFLGKYTFELLDAKKRDVIHKRLVKFLDDLAENKIIEKGKLTKFERNRDQPDRVDIDFSITPLWATRTFVYKIGVSKGESPESEVS
ncbi:MAG: hypothetical protein H6577_13760 [Lewinellaceae bacterium]|nr:hypothetical protein [Saprospiraceae bacterium]MCB9339192.1 hypothetical protein [Lewinellaceae bacterium]